MIRINQIKIPIEHDEKALINKIKKLIKTDNFKFEKIVKLSIDARKKDELYYIYTADISTNNEEQLVKRLRNNNINIAKDITYNFPYKIQDKQDALSPIIIGAGPAGYFCALYLARAGFKPIVIEQGKSVEERTKDVNNFWAGGEINQYSNVSFGEGGAGTFSDGKLNTGIKDKSGRIEAVINDFLNFGAPEDIAYLSKPHVGTNELKKIMRNMRNEIEILGGKVLFNTYFDNFSVINNKEINVETISTVDKSKNCFRTKALILAIGHSSRNTFIMLNEKNVPMETKAFAIGLRIEHPRDMIDESQYGIRGVEAKLPASSYKMTYHTSKGRGVYSFCMCPGGFVVNASSDKEQCVVNGMSNHSRDEVNSNSAIVVNVTPEDFLNEGYDKYGVLAGMYYQIAYEKKAFDECNGKIPVQLFKDLKANQKSEEFGDIKPNIKGFYDFGNLNNCLPEYVIDAIIEGINYYNTKLKGFSKDDSVLSGIESRTSSPVRINRNDDYMSNISGIFPCGEGAGYAGGITSAAVDGIKVAEAVSRYLLSD